MSEPKHLGEILCDMGFATKRQVRHALRIQSDLVPHKWLGEILIEEGVITQEQLYDALEAQFPVFYQHHRTSKFDMASISIGD